MCLYQWCSVYQPFLAEVHAGCTDAPFFFTIENKFAKLCRRLVVANAIRIGQCKRHSTATVLVDCHLMNVERIAVALDGQIDLLDCTLQALGRDTITKLSGVGIFRPRRAAICPGNGLSVAMVSPGRGKITGIDNSVGDPSGRQHSGKTSDYGNIQSFA